MIALTVFDSTLSHAGHTFSCACCESFQLTSTNVLSETECLLAAVEAGHSGCSLGGLTADSFVDEGVSEGTQKARNLVS